MDCALPFQIAPSFARAFRLGIVLVYSPLSGPMMCVQAFNDWLNLNTMSPIGVEEESCRSWNVSLLSGSGPGDVAQLHKPAENVSRVKTGSAFRTTAQYCLSVIHCKTSTFQYIYDTYLCHMYPRGVGCRSLSAETDINSTSKKEEEAGFPKKCCPSHVLA